MPDMQQQIDALREAFSADISKPFVLKPTFPYGSPVAQANGSPLRGGQYRLSPMDRGLDQHHSQQQPQVSYTTHPITPPISAGSVDIESDSPAVQSLVATGQRGPQQQQSVSSSVPIVVDSTSLNWNPSRIFE
jgi:hypothetical protein